MERDPVGRHFGTVRQLECDVDGLVHRIVVTPHNVGGVAVGPSFDSIAIIIESAGVRPECLDEQEATRTKVSGRRSHAGLPR